jgi:hypothetical protein
MWSGLTANNGNASREMSRKNRRKVGTPCRPPMTWQISDARAALMLGSEKSRGYCLEMICADFLAGANLNDGDPDVLLHALSRSFHFLPANQRQVFLQTITDEVQ